MMPSARTCDDKNSVAYDGARQGWFAQGFNKWISPTLHALQVPPPNEMFNTLFKHLEKEIKRM